MSAVPLSLTMPAALADSPCFHCGLPAGQGATQAQVAGAWQCFCCGGCEAATLTIAGLGLEDYYRLRSETGTRPEVWPDRFLSYDDPLFQAAFVHAAGDGLREAALLLEGVRCSACLWLIEETLKRIDGVQAINVNFVTRGATLCWRPEVVRLSEILQRLAALGYGAHPYRPAQAEVLLRAEKRQWLWRLFVAGFGMMQVMMYAVPAYIGDAGDLAPEYDTLMRWASFVLTLPVLLYSTQPFFAGAWRGLRAGRLGMDFPVALGIAIAFAASTWATFTRAGQVYFDSLTMFVFLLLLGRYLELLARDAAGRSLSYLARLEPALAERLKNFPTTRDVESVAVAKLAVGDVLHVKPGESIAADGVVLEGRSSVNEALISGESLPVVKQAGMRVIGGSTNMESPLLVRVQRVGEQGTLASIVRLVERAAAQKQPLAESADRYARGFVWLILGVTVLAATAWLFIDPARAPWIVVSLLVATCPCALSLATPAALTAATGRLARHGLIVTRGHAIESLARATDLVFDKTGTLTEGHLSVVAWVVKGTLPIADCMRAALALESASEHPVGKAIHRYAQTSVDAADAIDPGTLCAVPGRGVEARIRGRLYRLGNFEFCAALTGRAELHCPSAEVSTSAHTRVWLAREGELLARMELSDSLKAGAVEIVAALAASGRRVHLLSGDSIEPVMHIANRLNITDFLSSATPASKSDYVAALRERGSIVAMIGDGVNDAPVLAHADVSIAMGDGAALAQTHADAVLLNGKLDNLRGALNLCERSLRIVRQNLIWAFAYNAAVIPLAAAGLVNPWIAGVGMSLSSLLVVLNALRLARG